MGKGGAGSGTVYRVRRRYGQGRVRSSREEAGTSQVTVVNTELCTFEQAFAHTPNAAGEWHPLREHLVRTAELTKERAAKFGAGNLGYATGLLHDSGKVPESFQSYLLECFRAKAAGRKVPPPSSPHSAIGAYAALSLLSDPAARTVAATVILAHHSGLKDPYTTQARIREAGQKPISGQVVATSARELAAELRSSLGGGELPVFARTSRLSAEILARMLYSALLDADRVDAEAHGSPWKARLRTDHPSVDACYARLTDYQEVLIANAPRTLVNRVRREVYEACLDVAKRTPGVYRLSVPTGGGKTLSSLAFGLAHAKRWGLDRVIAAIPYTSIIDQTAAVYRKVLGDRAVLEHHSAVRDALLSAEGHGDLSEVALRRELATESWDSPVVVTTTVQLFESLFANGSRACRKLQNISRSVLVLDEVQTLPLELLTPILSMLKELVAHYGVTVVLCTATQPALEGRSPYLAGFGQVTDIVPDPKRLFTALRRVRYEKIPSPWTAAQVAQELGAYDQGLAVLNTRRNARAVLAELGPSPEVFHLSTFLCPAHRRQILSEIRHRLRLGLPCKVVSTQVVEAGVDLDFPKVFREKGPLDRIVQAAGRCNREGRLRLGEVVLFELKGGSQVPGAYRRATDEAWAMLQEGVDLDDPAIFETYFRALYTGVNTDLFGIEAKRVHFDFPAVAKAFRMIRDVTVPVVVPFGDSAELVRRLEREGPSRDLYRRLQMYEVGLSFRDAEKAQDMGLMHEVSDGLYTWTGVYDLRLGLSFDANEAL